ncbi:MAG: ComEC family competence protein [Candidatus Zambryskibacteria bacterium]|nr:ComEC family competence protein [Candidatus Zambryskibacteria bacterium]
MLSFIFGFIFGITIGSFVPVTAGFFIASIFVTGIIYFYKYFIHEDYKKILIICAVFMLGITFGIGRMWYSDLYSESKLTNYVGQKIFVEGIIVGEPDVRDSNTKLTVRLSSIFISTMTVPIREKILVTVPLYPEFKYGDKVRMNVSLSEPTEINGEDGRTFDYQGYLRARGIWFTSRYTIVELISSGHGSLVKSGLFKIKNAFVNSINSALPEPESNLLGGLLLGAKQSLGKELLTEFQKTGVSHIVVLSGYNIAIVADSIMNVLKFLPKNLGFGFGAFSIILFIILSGGSASAWRAGIMVLVALFAKKFNRDYKASRVLGFTIILMLAPNPLLLAFDPSFQLSVLATIGIIFVSPLILPYLTKVTERWGLREIISTTIATQITVLPFLVYNMGLFSLVSLPVNVLILGTIPLTMFLGFITGLFGLVSLYLSFIPAFFTYIFLWYQLTIIHIGASVPFGAVSLPVFSPIILIFIYSVIFYFLNKRKA